MRDSLNAIVSQMCVFFQLDTFLHLSPCRNGGHLQNCLKFECNLMFKCKNSYCIPWSYISDGKWDCPDGVDELKVTELKVTLCPYSYKCRKTYGTCVPVGLLCNGHHDCPYGDDELLCHLRYIKCPELCQCIQLAVKCTDSKDIIIHIISFRSFQKIYIHNTVIYSLANINLKLAIYVRLTNDNIKHICEMISSTNLLHLDLSNNLIESPESKCFITALKLKYISLENNRILSIRTEVFSYLKYLRFLNLDHNPLATLPKNFLTPAKTFQYLSISNIFLTDIDVYFFEEMSVNVIISNDFHICCIAPKQAVCTARNPWHLPCSELLHPEILKTFFPGVSLILLIANGISGILHGFNRKLNKSFTIGVIGVNLTGIICAIYLKFLSIADLLMKGKFLLIENLWRSSFPCFISFGLILWFLLLNPITKLLLSLSRLMIIINPIDTKFKQKSFFFSCLFWIYLTSLVCSMFLTITLKYTSQTLPLSLCLHITDPKKSIFLMNFITWFVAVMQTLLACTIVLIHIVLVKKWKESQKTIRKSKSEKESTAPLVLQLTILSVSNLLCWIPANLVFIMAVFLPKYPLSLIKWTVVSVLPVSSIIHPIVFIIMCVRKYFQT